MAEPVLLKDLLAWFGGYDFQGHVSSANLTGAKAELANGRFGDDVEPLFPGLQQIASEFGGFWSAENSSAPDTVIWPRIDPTLTPAAWPVVMIPPYSPAATPNTFGNWGYLVVGKQYSYNFTGQHGQLMPFSVRTLPATTYALYRQKLMAAKATVSATTTGTGFQLGELTASLKMVVSFHVFSITGTGAWTLTIESDDNSGFTSATTRATLTQVDQDDDPTFEVVEIAGPISNDDFWRAVLTEDSGTSSITYAVTMGIQNA